MRYNNISLNVRLSFSLRKISSREKKGNIASFGKFVDLPHPKLLIAIQEREYLMTIKEKLARSAEKPAKRSFND